MNPADGHGPTGIGRSALLEEVSRLTDLVAAKKAWQFG